MLPGEVENYSVPLKNKINQTINKINQFHLQNAYFPIFHKRIKLLKILMEKCQWEL